MSGRIGSGAVRLSFRLDKLLPSPLAAFISFSLPIARQWWVNRLNFLYLRILLSAFFRLEKKNFFLPFRLITLFGGRIMNYYRLTYKNKYFWKEYNIIRFIYASRISSVQFWPTRTQFWSSELTYIVFSLLCSVLYDIRLLYLFSAISYNVHRLICFAQNSFFADLIN